MKYLKAAIQIIAMVALLESGLVQRVHAESGSVLFPETNHEVKGRFLQYWESNGGLMQFGYPISDELTEVSVLNGQTYMVQYFERAEFELHPENQPPYDVLLTPLGSLYYKEKYPDATPNQVPNPDNPYIFKETGKTIGGAFRAYWESHGGLMQQGYPISNEFTEMSDIDGKPYTVQYFERAEFEYHPENQLPYDVLLSQLGRLRYQQVASHPGPNSSTLIGVADPGSEYAVLKGNVFWLSLSTERVYGYNVDTQQQFLVAGGMNAKTNLTSIRQQLVWVEQTAAEGGFAAQYSVQSYSIDGSVPAAQGHVSTLLTFTTTEQTKVLAVDQDNLYYEVHYSRPGVYARSLTTGQERQFLSYSGYNFVARDEGLLWTEVYCNPCGKYGAEGYRLHLLLHGSAKDTVVADVFGQDFDYPGYDISGENVVWVSMPGTHNGVHLYNIKSGLSRVIAEGDAHQPLISGHLVLWTTVGNTYPDPFGYPSIVIYDLDKMKVSAMVGADAGRVEAEAVGDTRVLVYVDKGSIYVLGLG